MAVVKTKFLKERRRNIIHYVSSRKRTRKHEMEKCKTKVISFFFLMGTKKLIIESVIFHKLHFICLVYCVLQNGSCRLEFLVCTIAYNPSVQRLCGLVLIAFLEKLSIFCSSQFGTLFDTLFGKMENVVRWWVSACV